MALKVFSRESPQPNCRYWSYVKPPGLRMTPEWGQRPNFWKPRASWFSKKTAFFAIIQSTHIWPQKIFPGRCLRWSWRSSDNSPGLGEAFEYLHWRSETHWTRFGETWNFVHFGNFKVFFCFFGRFFGDLTSCVLGSNCMNAPFFLVKTILRWASQKLIIFPLAVPLHDIAPPKVA